MTTEKTNQSLILLALLFNLLPAAIADIPQTPQPNAEVVGFGLQAVRADFAQEVPVTVSDVMAGQRPLSSFSLPDQAFVQSQFERYAASVPHSTDDEVLQSAAKAALLAHDPYPQKPLVSFVLHPYTLLLPGTLPRESKKNDITAYGQPVNIDNPDFAEFLSSLSPMQKAQVLQGSALGVNNLSRKQQTFICALWQNSAHPEYSKLSSLPDTKIAVRFYFEAVVMQPYQTGSITYHLRLPQPDDSRVDAFVFHAARGQQGQVWMQF